MLTKTKQKTVAMFGIVVLTMGVGLSASPVVNIDAKAKPSVKNFKPLPKAYQKTWYSVGRTVDGGETINMTVKFRLTKTKYGLTIDESYQGMEFSNMITYPKYSARKAKNGAYKITTFIKVHGKWVPDMTDTLKIMTKKFNGKCFKVLKEGTGNTAIYHFKNVKQANQSKYNVANAYE